MICKPKISFVVPVYNAAPWLPTTLHSLIKQRYRNIEIIILNDGSTDHIEELGKYYSKKDKRIKYVHGDGRRHGGATRRNQGNRLAQADIICVTDAGDEYHTAKAGTVKDHFEKFPDTDIFYHSVKIVNLLDQDQRVTLAFPPMLKERPRGISHPTVSYKKELILKHPYREDCVDTDQYEAMLMTFYREGYKFNYTRNILLKKRAMEGLQDYRDMKNASLQKIKIYKEFDIDIEPWLLRRAGCA